LQEVDLDEQYIVDGKVTKVCRTLATKDCLLLVEEGKRHASISNLLQSFNIRSVVTERDISTSLRPSLALIAYSPRNLTMAVKMQREMPECKLIFLLNYRENRRAIIQRQIVNPSFLMLPVTVCLPLRKFSKRIESATVRSNWFLGILSLASSARS
jgi:hypothetical protein